MEVSSEELIDDLTRQTSEHIRQAEAFTHLPLETLNRKSDAESWSALECVEHLNRYGDFYIPEIRKQINTSRHLPAANFRSGRLGNYFAKSMLPKEKLNKMKTFKSMNPAGSRLNADVIKRFLAQQEQILELLKAAKEVNLTKTKTAISISKWIKLRLGDTFRVVIYHNERHILQATKVAEYIPKLTGL